MSITPWHISLLLGRSEIPAETSPQQECSLIDCHILTLPNSNPQWMSELQSDLNREPVVQHWLPGIYGDLAGARAAAFAAGSRPYVTWADHDDRIAPGTFAALIDALEKNPAAPFAWAGELRTDSKLLPIAVPNVPRAGYHPVSHITEQLHVHGVRLYRRESVMTALDLYKQAGPLCEAFLDLYLSKPWVKKPCSEWPVGVGLIGRLWRQHSANGSRMPTSVSLQEAADMVAKLLGFPTFKAMCEEVLAAHANGYGVRPAMG